MSAFSLQIDVKGDTNNISKTVFSNQVNFKQLSFYLMRTINLHSLAKIVSHFAKMPHLESKSTH